MARHSRRKSARRSKRSTRGKRSTHAKRGGGFSLDPSKFVSAGNLENLAYTGVGKDCPGGSYVRPGFISNYGGSGMPGMSGGKRRSRGGYEPAVAPIVDSPVHFPSAPGVPPQNAEQVIIQKGGRYESNPGALLDGGSDIGMKFYSGAHSIPCERGSTNSLNMHGGAVPTVTVGAADSMRYNAPTAGYGHGFETLPGSAVGGLMINTPYDARAFNPACTKTGGGPVAHDAAPYASLQLDQITGRGDFDGSKGLLPMKYGGKRRTHRKRSHKHSHRCKHSSRRKHSHSK
jgi:hypothetical protein